MARPTTALRSSQKVAAARDRWRVTCKAWSHLDGTMDSAFAFATFLGDPYDGLRAAIVDYEGNPEIQRLIDLINGDDGVAILKMLEIKFLEKKNERTRARIAGK